MKLPALALALIVASSVAPVAYAAPQAKAPPPCKAAPPPKASPKTPKPDEPVADPAVAAANLATAKTFMAENARKPGVISLPSGVQYKILTSGAADAGCATRDDRLRIHYEGTLPDGAVFDTTLGGAPAVLTLDGLIQGWQIAVPMMRMGDEWQIFVPPALGYGVQYKEKIPVNSPLIFKLKIVGIM